jgi:hypothetical protein
MLIAARSSKDFACCLRATSSAWAKYSSAFARSGAGDLSAISPAMRWTSASNHVSPVVFTAVIASLMTRAHYWHSHPRAHQTLLEAVKAYLERRAPAADTAPRWLRWGDDDTLILAVRSNDTSKVSIPKPKDVSKPYRKRGSAMTNRRRNWGDGSLVGAWQRRLSAALLGQR